MYEAEAQKTLRLTILVIVAVSVLSGGAVLFISLYQSWAGGVAREIHATPEPRRVATFEGPVLEEQEGEVLARVRAAEEKQLAGYGWVDRSQGLAKVPIDVAMEVYVQRASTSTTAEGGTP